MFVGGQNAERESRTSQMPGGSAGGGGASTASVADNEKPTMAMSDKLSGIEEESDMYDAFAPHVDTSQIAILTDSPAGKFQSHVPVADAFSSASSLLAPICLLYLLREMFVFFLSFFFLYTLVPLSVLRVPLLSVCVSTVLQIKHYSGRLKSKLQTLRIIRTCCVSLLFLFLFLWLGFSLVIFSHFCGFMVFLLK